MNWSFKQNVDSSPGKFILVILANMANQEGKCWPGIDYLARITELSRRSVFTHMRHLEELGLISQTIRPGDGSGRKSNLYQLAIGQGARAAPCGNVQLTGGQCATDAGQGAAPAPKQSINNQKNNHSCAFPMKRFDEMWAAYPKKANKKQAREIWKRQKLDKIADQIIRDIQARIKTRQWANPQYIPHPGTYLKNERWKDELQQAGADSPIKLPPDNELQKWAKKHGFREANIGESWAAYRQYLETAAKAAVPIIGDNY